MNIWKRHKLTYIREPKHNINKITDKEAYALANIIFSYQDNTAWVCYYPDAVKQMKVYMRDGKDDQLYAHISSTQGIELFRYFTSVKYRKNIINYTVHLTPESIQTMIKLFERNKAQHNVDFHIFFNAQNLHVHLPHTVYTISAGNEDEEIKHVKEHLLISNN